MDMDSDDLERLEMEAAGILAAANGKVKITKAMELVGFDSSERKNMKIYQRVRRKAQRLRIVEANAQEGYPLGDVTATAGCGASIVSTLTNETRVVDGSGNLASASSHEDDDSEMLDTDLNPVVRRLYDTPPPAARQGGAVGQKDNAKIPAAKKTRRNSKDVRRKHAQVVMQTQKEKKAMKLATTLISRSKALPAGHPEKKSINVIVAETNMQCDSNISPKTAARYVRDGLVNTSPMKRGPIGHFSKTEYNALKGAYTTYLKLEQSGGKKQSTMKQLSRLVNKTVNLAGHQKSRDDLSRKLKKDTADQFEVGKANVTEQRRTQWTTSYNLGVWFDTWKTALVELGFAREIDPIQDKDTVGELVFLPGQKDRIVNFDETDGSLDDTTGQRGGRPPMTFYSKDVAGGGTSVNKTGYNCTVICGSTASGDPVPPHFQLKTLAQESSREKISVDWFVHCKDVVGTFGSNRRKAHPCTFGMNERAGMNSVELDKYIKNAILPLYPDIADKPQKRVFLKVDSGPGRNNTEMLAHTRINGLYLVPGVPNTTHVTQETDQSYGPYKSIVRSNLRELSQARFDMGLTMQVSDLPLIVFGGVCEQTKLRVRDAFSEAFSVEQNLRAWQKCGAVPLTRSVLNNAGVRNEIAVEGAAEQQAPEDRERAAGERLINLENLNKHHCDTLSAFGFDGSQLRKLAPRRRNYVAVTQPQSLARIQAIKQAKTSGQMFYATGGQHINSNEFFQARALAEKESEVKVLEETKADRLAALSDEAAADALFQEKGCELTQDTADKFTNKDLKVLLKWTKAKSNSNRKEDMLLAYFEHPVPPPAKPWTHREEAELIKMKNPVIPLHETALGTAAVQAAHAVEAQVALLPKDCAAKLMQALRAHTGEVSSED